MSSFDRNAFDAEICRLLTKAEETIPNEILADLPYMKLAPDVHEWYRFEHELWEIGEEIRQFISKHNKKLNESQINRILNICLDKRAKRGRQSFVMLLGRKMYRDYSDRLISVINDDDIAGHVIDTLYKMQEEKHVELISPFLQHDRTWIRNVAKKYIQRFK
ncbi:MAG: hypothetical protein IKB53_02495 [Oscillospiraceae bacterium]|nr:hypothetical protein [Oscillospiraceae bacterium]